MKMMVRLVVDKAHLGGLVLELVAAGYNIWLAPDAWIEPYDREEYAFLEATRELSKEEVEDYARDEAIPEARDAAGLSEEEEVRIYKACSEFSEEEAMIFKVSSGMLTELKAITDRHGDSDCIEVRLYDEEHTWRRRPADWFPKR